MEYAEVARSASERGELVLRSRTSESGPTALELRVNGVFVMDTVETSSEQALAAAALAVCDRPAEVLIGGLGLGYTMHAVLGDSRVERCTVIEIEQSLVDWLRDGTVPHGPGFLADERARVVVADVSLALAEAQPASYDLVLLDVDNGPAFLVYASNAALYDAPFLRVVHRVLKPGGVLVVWSADEAPDLAAALAEEFALVERQACPVRLQGRDDHYWLYVARVASAV